MKKVINDLLNYNNLKIVQCDEYFNFSLDSVLLANFVRINPSIKNIIDLGTGNAPIPMILSTFFSGDVNIIGVELQKKIFDLAKESLKINNLDGKIKLLNDDIKNIGNLYESDFFDVVISNPPYFKRFDKTKINDNKIKSIARHEIFITIDEIIKVSKKVLKNNGSFYSVNRTDRFVEILVKLKENNLEPKRIQFIYPKVDKPSNLFLIEAVKNGKEGLKIENPFFVHESDGKYKEEVLKIFGGYNDSK